MSTEGSTTRLQEWLDETSDWAERELERAVDSFHRGTPAKLDEAVRYALFGGGKRLRPALVRLVCQQLGGSDEAASIPAVAIECVHTYSLVHDDLPCMDDDDLRRGRATTHKVYGEALAVLVGDALQAAAFEWLARSEHAAAMTAVLARAAGPSGMVGGQVLDLASSASENVEDEVTHIHALKTAALLGAAAELGAIAAGATATEREAMATYGRSLGLCFQAVDDLLDVTGDVNTLGKTPGKDAAYERATLVSAVGLEDARRRAAGLAEEARRAARAAGCAEDSLALAMVERVLLREH